MPVELRVLGSWSDVCALPDGRFVGVQSEAGKIVAQIIDGPVLWQTDIPTDIARYQRCAASSDGEVRAIGVGADDHAYVASASGWTVLGKVGGQNAVAIGWNGRAFVTFRTLYNEATREVSSYARRVSVVALDDGEDLIMPIPIGNTSQGFREAIPGPSQTEDRIVWSDNLPFQHVNGRVLHKPSERNGVIVGQIDGPDDIQGWNGSQFFHAISGPAYEPRIAANGRGDYAICARTGRGAAFIMVPPFPAINVPPVDPPPVDPPKEPPSMQMPIAAWRVVEAMHAKFGAVLPATEDGARELTRMTIEQLLFVDTTGGWCWKRADPTRPPSKDCVARQIDGRFEGWDIFASAGVTGPRVLATYPPTYHDLIAEGNQVPIPVTAQNHLGGGDNDDPGDTDPPPVDPPPSGDLLARIAALEADVAKLKNARIELRLVL